MSELLTADQKIFLEKLTDIVLKNLANENFGAKELARESGLSYYGLNRRLNSINRKNINQFIREIRLQKALEMLQNESLTVAEIAYKVGFSSASYFIKCFHNYFGHPPGKVKKGSFVSPEEAKPVFQIPGFSLPRVLVVTALVVTVILLVFYVLDRKRSERFSKLEKSIAVLPFVNNSPDQENTYFINGIMEKILNNLQMVKELRVISRTSVERYRNTTKSIPEVGKELGVNYILEGSGQKYGNSFSVSVQLIKADKESHLWGKSFEKEIKEVQDILTIQNQIAQTIAAQLKAAITPKEKEIIENTNTNNLEAYNSYLLGRFFWNKRTEEGLKKSVTYFEQSIIEDPDNALAYAGMADALNIQAFWGWTPRAEGYAKAKELALKAISLDENLADAHATLGSILCFNDWKWDEAQKEFLISISINPNYATAHQYYSEYFEIIGENDDARIQIDLARDIDPLSAVIHYVSARYYYYEGKFEESLEEFGKVLELNPDYNAVYWQYFFIYATQGEDLKLVEVLQKIMTIDTLTIQYTNTVKEVYNRSGKKGLLNWLIELYLEDSGHFKDVDITDLARCYAMLDENEKAFTSLEKALEEHATNIIRINSFPEFVSLRTDPGFLDILRELGLSN